MTASVPSAATSMRSRPLPVTVISGFLGAGKTTLLRRLLRDRSDLRIAVIVNDLSDLAVDADLVKELREGHEELVIDLHAGSLGGALRPAFLEALDRVAADASLDYLLIETSGGSHPHILLEDLQRHRGVTLDSVVTVVDGLNLLRDFDGGRALLTDVPALVSPVGLLRAQIEAASVLLMSKADRLTRDQVASLFSVLQRINPHALLVSIAYGQVNPALVVGARSFRKRRRRPRGEPVRRPPVSPAADDPALYGLGAVTLRDARPFHPQRLHALVRHGLPLGVHRSKGWMWLALPGRREFSSIRRPACYRRNGMDSRRRWPNSIRCSAIGTASSRSSVSNAIAPLSPTRSWRASVPRRNSWRGRRAWPSTIRGRSPFAGCSSRRCR